MLNINTNKTSNNNSKTGRIFYLDALRTVAIIAVIVIHVASGTQGISAIGNSNYHSLSWYLNDFFQVCFRIGVSLFLVLAGSLSLGRQWTIKKFLKKRIPRIVIPFLFWGFVCCTAFLLLAWFLPDLFSPKDFNVPFNLIGYLNYLYLYYLADTITSYPYWFFWMILGTYLIMPIFNKWVYHSDLKELEYFLFFWLITCTFNFTLGYEFPITLTYFVSPIGLVVLGYYLRYTERKILNNPYIALLLIIISSLLAFILSYMYSTPDVIYIFDRYSILMSLEVIGVFLLFKNFNKFNININFLKNPKGIFRKSIFSIAKCSYGMYLNQAFIIYIVYRILVHYFHISQSHKSLCLILILILSIIISWQIINLLSRIRNLGKIVGAK